MSKQTIEFGPKARGKLMVGINKLTDAVTTTLGPNGRNVIYGNGETVLSTKDGVSVAKSIVSLDDPIEDLGIQLIKQASIKTAETAGDGTTTSTLLAREIISNGLIHLNNGVNAVDLKKGIEEATREVITFINKNIKEDISSEDQLQQIATISANNDPEVGTLIATAMEKVGREGVVHIEESKSGETYLETVEGMQFDRGYKSHFFVTNNNNMTCVLNDVLVLIADKKFGQVKELLPILEAVSSEGKQLLIIAEDIEGEALATLIVNKARGTIKIAAVKSPEFGDRRKLILEDIAILTGGQVFSPEKGMKLDKFSWDWFGKARLVNITKDQTTIIDGGGDEDKIKQRVEELQKQIEEASSAYEKEKLQERLAKLTGGISIIHVGGFTETEMKEKKDRVDDALQATKAALEEGIIPGGGVTLLYARKGITFPSTNSPGINLGKQIVYDACSSPFMKILSNAGHSQENIYNLINLLKPTKTNWNGYNIKSESIVDMKEEGIIDPAKVCRCAIENASSVGSMVILTECIIVDKKEENNINQQDNYNM